MVIVRPDVVEHRLIALFIKGEGQDLGGPAFAGDAELRAGHQRGRGVDRQVGRGRSKDPAEEERQRSVGVLAPLLVAMILFLVIDCIRRGSPVRPEATGRPIEGREFEMGR